MTALSKALSIILAIDLLFFLSQFAILDINPYGPQFYNYNGSILSQYDQGNYTVLDAQNAAEDLPDASSAVTEDTTDSNFITDAYTTIKGWLTGLGDSAVIRGTKYVWSILGGPTAYLNIVNAPREFTFAIGTMWYATTFMIILGALIFRN